LLLAAIVVCPVDRVYLKLMPLPGCSLSSLTFQLFAGSLVLVPRTRIKIITAINTWDLFHTHHLG